MPMKTGSRVDEHCEVRVEARAQARRLGRYLSFDLLSKLPGCMRYKWVTGKSGLTGDFPQRPATEQEGAHKMD